MNTRHPGIALRLAQLFRGKKNLVISAVDHVVEYGDQPGLEKVETAIQNCRTTDALLLPRFMLERNWPLLATRKTVGLGSFGYCAE